MIIIISNGDKDSQRKKNCQLICTYNCIFCTMSPYTQTFMHTMPNWNWIVCMLFCFTKTKPLLWYAKDCGRHARKSSGHEERRERESAKKKWKQNSHRQIEVATQNKILNTPYYFRAENNDDDDDDKKQRRIEKKKLTMFAWSHFNVKIFQSAVLFGCLCARFAMWNMDNNEFVA